MTISIRQLMSEDWQIFSALRLAALKECPGMFGLPLAVEEKYTASEWQNFIHKNDRAFFGLFDDGQLISIAGVVPDEIVPEAGNLTCDYVRPDYRRRGLSNVFYPARIAWAKNYKPWRTLVVRHRVGNEPSRRAIARHGFTYVSRTPIPWPDGVTADALLYRMELR